MSRQGDKARAAWLDRCRAALIDATGAAVCAGLIDAAHQINAIALDIDRKTCYTDKNARNARKTEDNIMANKIKVWAFTANGVGWNRAKTMYFDSREHAEAAYAHYTYKDPIYYAGAFASDKFEPAYPIDYGAIVHEGQLYPTDKY